MGVAPGRNGNEFGFAVPANVYDCSDGPIYLGVLLDAHWKILAEILGQPDLAENEAFATGVDRVQNRDICNFMVADWCGRRTREEAINALVERGLPVAPVQTFVEAAKDPHVQERDMLQKIKIQGVDVPITGPAAKFSRTPTRVRTKAPDLGEHTDEILEELGIDAEAREKLRRGGLAV